MKPIGPLMWEHRLIERLVQAVKAELRRIVEDKSPDPHFIELAVDFFRTYADRTHHGKEEDILFRDLAQKQLAPEHKRVMDELVAEHIQARQMVRSLAAARESYLVGNKKSVQEIVSLMQKLAEFYPRHIEKEDKHFFYPCLEYFSREEQDQMLQEFWEFDRKMVHEKYEKLVEELKQKPAG